MNSPVKVLYIFIFWALAAGSGHATIEISIDTGTETFTGLLLEGSDSPSVGVIFFHGRGQHPDGDVVRHLRNSLHAEGYTTLSLENPVPVTGNTSFDDYKTHEDTIDDQVFARATAAVNELVSRNSRIDTLIISGFSLGSRFATAVAAAWEQGLLTGISPGIELAGLVGAGMYSGIGATSPTIIPPATTDDINVYDTLRNLELIAGIPVLDIYGHLDSGAANPAPARRSAFGGDPGAYTQAELTCPDFSSETWYARNSGLPVPYEENRCHQLRNGFLTAEHAINQSVDLRLRGTADAPLESSASSWFATHAPLTPPPVSRELPFLPLLLDDTP